MTKTELIARLARAHPHLTVREAQVAVETFFSEVAAAMARGGRVELRGFGSFLVRRLGAWDGRNPRTGAVVSLPERRFPVFRPSKMLGDRLGPAE